MKQTKKETIKDVAGHLNDAETLYEAAKVVCGPLAVELCEKTAYHISLAFLYLNDLYNDKYAPYWEKSCEIEDIYKNMHDVDKYAYISTTDVFNLLLALKSIIKYSKDYSGVLNE